MGIKYKQNLARNCKKCVDLERKKVYNIYPYGSVGGGQVPKFFDRNYLKCRDLHGNNIYNMYPHGIGAGWGQIPKIYFATNCIKWADLYRRIMSLTIHPIGVGMGMGGESSIIFCKEFHEVCRSIKRIMFLTILSPQKNFCQELYEMCRCVEKIVFLTLYSHGGRVGWGVKYQIFFLLGIAWCPDLQRKITSNHPWRWRWRGGLKYQQFFC